METSIIITDEENNQAKHVCFGCNLPIVDRFLSNVLDKLWHDRCIRCCECKVVLKDKCFSRDFKLYCKQDFYRYVFIFILFIFTELLFVWVCVSLCVFCVCLCALKRKLNLFLFLRFFLPWSWKICYYNCLNPISL